MSRLTLLITLVAPMLCILLFQFYCMNSSLLQQSYRHIPEGIEPSGLPRITIFTSRSFPRPSIVVQRLTNNGELRLAVRPHRTEVVINPGKGLDRQVRVGINAGLYDLLK